MVSKQEIKLKRGEREQLVELFSHQGWKVYLRLLLEEEERVMGALGSYRDRDDAAAEYARDCFRKGQLQSIKLLARQLPDSILNRGKEPQNVSQRDHAGQEAGFVY